MSSRVSPENSGPGIAIRLNSIVAHPRLKELKDLTKSQSTNEKSYLIPELCDESPMTDTCLTDRTSENNLLINPTVRRVASMNTVVSTSKKRATIDPNASAVSSGGSTGRKKPIRWKKVKGAAEVVGCLNEYKKEILLFGSSKIDLPREPPPPPPRPKYIIPHDNKFKMWWDRFLVVVYIYLVSIMPVTICFYAEEPTGFYIVNMIINVIFAIDIILTFFTSYVDMNNQPVYDIKQIAINYLTGWFIVDLISTIPFSSFFKDDNKRYSQLIRLSKLLRIIRLIRVFKLNHIFKSKSSLGISDFILMNRNAGLFRLLKFYMYTIICIHISSCIWFLVAQSSSFTPDTWIYRRYCANLIKECESPTSTSEMLLPGYYACTKDEVITAENICSEYAFSHRITMYLDGLYFALSTILTVGYGDITAFTDIERILVIFLMFIGGTLYSIQISSLTSFISTLDDKENIYQRNLDRINTFCNESNLSSEIRLKMKRDYTYAFKNGNTSVSIPERDMLLQLISPKLRVEVLSYICKHVVDIIPFFRNKDTMFVSKCVDLLKPVEYKDKEYVMREGQYTCGMFFVVKGSVILIADDENNNSKELRIMCEGGFFGESAAFCPFNRYSCRSKGNCELFVLSRRSLKEILSEFPHMAQELRDIAEKREQKLFQGLLSSSNTNSNANTNSNNTPSNSIKKHRQPLEYHTQEEQKKASLLSRPNLRMCAPSPSQRFRNLTPLKKFLIKSKSKELLESNSNRNNNDNDNDDDDKKKKKEEDEEGEKEMEDLEDVELEKSTSFSPIPPPTPPPSKSVTTTTNNNNNSNKNIRSIPRLAPLQADFTDSPKLSSRIDINLIQNTIDNLQELLKCQYFVESGLTPPHSPLNVK